MESELVHVVEHGSFVAVSLLLWHSVLVGLAAARGVAVLVVFTAAFQSTVLSALFTFANSPWYETYLSTAEAWGLRALDDQRLAGVIMWVPGGLLYLAVGLTLFAMWIHDPELDGSASTRANNHATSTE